MDNNLFSSFYLYKKHKQFICTNAIQAYIQYKDFRIDLLTGARSKETSLNFLSVLSEYSVEDYVDKPIVIHLFFEFGFTCSEQEELIDRNKPLAIFIKYGQTDYHEIYENSCKDTLKFSPLSIPKFEEYHEKFQKTYKNLLDGECYQLNLTMPFYLRANEKIQPRDYINHLWSDPLKVGAYAHATYIDSLGKLFLSNSPECLFQIEKKQDEYFIKTMPIKGTKKVANENNRDEAWQSLLNSKKDESELYMISDLMRNDLTRINLTPAKITHKKCPLNVPGLVHQFSVITAELLAKTNLENIIKELFPGGSITGAPKKNVMELIRKIENYNRGFYCGSTVLLYKNCKTASINIRSAEIDYIQDEIKYGSGGGITLMSQSRDEYDEALAKLKSFLLLLN